MENDNYHNVNVEATNTSYGNSGSRLQPHSNFADDVAVIFVIIASSIAVASGAFVAYGLWRSRRQHRRLLNVVAVDSNDFLLYAQMTQHEMSSAPCKTSLPCQMPYVGGLSKTGIPTYPIIVPGYVKIVQVTHPLAKEQNYRKGKRRSVVVKKPETKAVEIILAQTPPKSTSSAPAILSGLWQQRHLLTGNRDALVDSFTALKKPMRPQRARASLSDTSPVIGRMDDQSRRTTCEQCGSGSSLLAGSFPRNISCRLCWERAGIRDVGTVATNRTMHKLTSSTTTNTSRQTARRDTAVSSVVASPKSPGRPKLSTFPDGRWKSCTAEVRAQLDPFRTMVLSSSSEDLTSDSD